MFDQFKSGVDRHPTAKALSINIQGMNSAKLVDLIHMISPIQPVAVCLSETHCTECIQDSELKIPGYKFFVSYSDNRHTGGIIIYFKAHIGYTAARTPGKFLDSANKNENCSKRIRCGGSVSVAKFKK